MLIIGLGNPGTKYKDTRHNIGFMAIDSLAEANSIKLNKKDFESLWGKGSIKDKEVILLKPQTYMNLSGEAVQAVSDYFDIEPKDILVIYDDIDLELGMMRIRLSGGSGGHNGMESIIEHLGTNDFPRIRLGIGRPDIKKLKVKSQKSKVDVAEYVLNPFDPEEKTILKPMLEKTKEAVDVIVNDGIEKAMNKYNRQ
ncbi:MAG: aminoacyl-tRNA hydrolase [Deltaproteobacteria bacterium]|nr:aminoacyl-tRNA hydrolase [Deltaproteobacteria bacterium]